MFGENRTSHVPGNNCTIIFFFLSPHTRDLFRRDLYRTTLTTNIIEQTPLWHLECACSDKKYSLFIPLSPPPCPVSCCSLYDNGTLISRCRRRRRVRRCDNDHDYTHVPLRINNNRSYRRVCPYPPKCTPDRPKSCFRGDSP